MQHTDQTGAAPETVVAEFIAAAQASDEARGKAVCTGAGWQDGDDPVRGLFLAISRRGLQVDTIGAAHRFGSRAAQRVALSHARAPRPLGDLCFLLKRTEREWRIAGATKVSDLAALFLWGRIGAAPSWRTLPPDDVAEAWAQPITQALQQGDAPRLDAGTELLSRRIAPDQVRVEMIDAITLAGADRSAVGWRFTTPDDSLGHDAWVVLDMTASPPSPVACVEHLDLESMVSGLNLAWPFEDPSAPGVALTEQQRPTDPAAAASILEGLLRRSFSKDGVDLEADTPDAERARELLRHVQRIVPRGQTAPAPRAAAQQLVLPPALQASVASSIQRLVDEGVAGPGGLVIDKTFIERHGGALVGGLFASMLGDALPPAVELTVPVDRPAPGGPDTIRVTARPRELLDQLLAEGE